MTINQTLACHRPWRPSGRLAHLIAVFSLAAAYLIVPATCAFAHSVPEKPLLPQSARLFAQSAAHLQSSVNHECFVDSPWLSAHEVIHFAKDYELSRYDLDSKKDTFLPLLSQQIKKSGAAPCFVDASNDGKWVMWGKSTGGPIFVASVDGSKTTSTPDPSIGWPYWFGAGSRWMDLAAIPPVKGVDSSVANLHDAANPNGSETIKALPKGLDDLDIMAVVSDHLIVAGVPDPTKQLSSKTSSVTHADGSVSYSEVSNVQDYPQKVQIISEWDLHSQRNLAVWTIRLPSPSSDDAASPDGKYLAWIVDAEHDRKGYATFRQSLYVCRVDGSDLHPIGYVEEKVATKGPKDTGANADESNDRPCQPNWSPDDKRISFQYKGALWSVPVQM